MSGWKSLKKTYYMCRRLKEQRGGAAILYLIDAVYCAYKHGASPENYFVLRFYADNRRTRGEFLTSGRSKECDRALNAKATAADKRALAQKSEFNKAFAEFITRESIYAPECGYGEFAEFLSRHEEFILKPNCGTMGGGIERLRVTQLASQEALYRSCREHKLLLEAIIPQHPALCAINAACVNSVRINAARTRDGRVALIGACLKCGRGGACTDNFHSGGIAYPLDLSTGRISGAGRSNTEICDYTVHPGAGVYMPGYQLPHWEAVTQCVKRAMDIVPSVGYAGWDVAITPQGAELIEGNFNWPGGNIIQFDNIGKYTLLKECVGEADE